jgi:hypothetical protein
MNWRSLGWLVLFAATACQAAPMRTASAEANAAGPAPATMRQPLATFSGSRSAITAPAMHRVQTQAELRTLWARHRGTEGPIESVRWLDDSVECPVVDFEHCEVVMVFSKRNSYGGVAVAELLDEPHLRRLRLEPKTAQEMAGDGTVRVRRYTEYGFFVLPRRDVAVVIEVDDCSVIGGAPIWKEVARL